METFWKVSVSNRAGYTTIAASSGNAGVSLAGYAQAAKVKCIIVSTKDIGASWSEMIKKMGAEIVFSDAPKDRRRYVKEKVEAGD